MNSKPTADRSPPPDVPPVVYKGVRYEQDLRSKPAAGNAPGGLLAAFDAKGGQRLWQLQVYTVRDHAAAGVDTPGRFFRSMALVRGKNQLAIEDEVGARFVVDLEARSATQISGPPQTAEPAPVKPKPTAD